MCQIAGVPVLASLAVIGCLIEKFLALLDAVTGIIEECHIIAALGIAAQQFLVGGLSCTGCLVVMLIAATYEGIAFDSLLQTVVCIGAQQSIQRALAFVQLLRLSDAAQAAVGTVWLCWKECFGTLKGDGFIATVAASEGCQCRNDDGKNKYLFHERNEELFILFLCFLWKTYNLDCKITKSNHDNNG